MNPTVKLVVILVTTTVLVGGVSVLIWYVAKFTFGNKCEIWQELNSRNMCQDKQCPNDPKTTGKYVLSKTTGKCDCSNPTQGGGCGCPINQVAVKTADGSYKCYPPCKGDLVRNLDGDCVCTEGVACAKDKSICCGSQAACVTNKDNTVTCCPKERWTGDKCCALGEKADGNICVSVCGNIQCTPSQSCNVITGPGGKDQAAWELDIKKTLDSKLKNNGNSGGVVDGDAYFCSDESGCILSDSTYYPPDLSAEYTNNQENFYPYYQTGAGSPYSSSDNGGSLQICMPLNQETWASNIADPNKCLTRVGPDTCPADGNCQNVDLAKVISETDDWKGLFNTLASNANTSNLGAYCYDPDRSGSYFRTEINKQTGGTCTWEDCAAKFPEAHGTRVQWVPGKDGNKGVCVSFPIPGEDQTIAQKITCPSSDPTSSQCCEKDDAGKTVDCVRCLSKGVPCKSCESGDTWVKYTKDACTMPTDFPQCATSEIDPNSEYWKAMLSQYKTDKNEQPLNPTGTKRMLMPDNGGNCPLDMRTGAKYEYDLQRCNSGKQTSADITCTTLGTGDSAWINTTTATGTKAGSKAGSDSDDTIYQGMVCDNKGVLQQYYAESEETRTERMCRAFNSYLDANVANKGLNNSWFRGNCDKLIAGADNKSPTRFAIQSTSYANAASSQDWGQNSTPQEPGEIGWCAPDLYKDARCFGPKGAGTYLTVDPSNVQDWGEVMAVIKEGDPGTLKNYKLEQGNADPDDALAAIVKIMKGENASSTDRTKVEKDFGISWPDGDCNVKCDYTPGGAPMDCSSGRLPALQANTDPDNSGDTPGMVAGLSTVSYPNGGESYVVYSNCQRDQPQGVKNGCGVALWGNAIRKYQYKDAAKKPPMQFGAEGTNANIYSDSYERGTGQSDFCTFSDASSLACDAKQISRMCHNLYFTADYATANDLGPLDDDRHSWNHKGEYDNNGQALGSGGLAASGCVGGEMVSCGASQKNNLWGGPWNTVKWGSPLPDGCAYQCPKDNPAKMTDPNDDNGQTEICNSPSFSNECPSDKHFNRSSIWNGE